MLSNHLADPLAFHRHAKTALARNAIDAAVAAHTPAAAALLGKPLPCCTMTHGEGRAGVAADLAALCYPPLPS